MKEKNLKRSAEDQLTNVVKKVKKDSNFITFKEAKKVITNWTFKARVTHKTDIKNYASGNLFNFDLIDSSGQIRCVVYHPLVEHFFEKVDVTLIFWRSAAIDFSKELNSILIIKGGKINEFNNTIKLSIVNTTIVTDDISEVSEGKRLQEYLEKK
ncbi:uncharacterized protein LOC116417915 isoform X2 [Nasonia vitripennis]|nr:uncharacterized protein LOC116417915 isoform X2 [Nasonia vitripennis]